jgi:hypothetical protein
MKRTHFTKEEELDICLSYISGLNTVIIANKYDTYNTSIRRILLRNNIVLRPVGFDQRKVKDNPFIDINNSEVQYWIGLLATDGCITNDSIVLQLQEKDKYLLDKYCKFLGGTIKVNKYYNKKYNIFEYYVKFKNPSIKKTLIEYGIIPQKSFNLCLNIPITYSLLRGVIDGDGSIINSKGQTKITIVSGSKLFLEQIKLFLLKEDIKSTIISYKNLFILSIFKQKQIVKLYNFLYNDAIIFLQRKKDKFGPLLEKFNSKNTLNSGKVLAD